MVVFIASDHRGFAQKENLFLGLKSAGVEVEDLGPDHYNKDDDFNDAAIKISKKVLENPEENRGILICGTAHGVAMQANRFKGIRAIVAFNPELAALGRQHEDANVLCLSADFTSEEDNAEIIKTFLQTAKLTDERYARRNRRLDEDKELN